MHNPCIDLYPVEAIAAYQNPYSHPRIEQRRMRTKLLLGVFRRHQSSRSRIAPILRVGWRENTYLTADPHRIYYDRDLRFGSDDPANPAVTRRVLTIMLADEY